MTIITVALTVFAVGILFLAAGEKRHCGNGRHGNTFENILFLHGQFSTW